MTPATKEAIGEKQQTSLPPAAELERNLSTERATEAGRLISIPNTTMQDPRDVEELLRPILVGYAFGPKKMSTMGVVMAEASKTHLSTLATTVLVEETEEDEAGDNDEAVNLDHDNEHDDHEDCRRSLVNVHDDDESSHNHYQSPSFQHPPPEEVEVARPSPATEDNRDDRAAVVCEKTARSSPRRNSNFLDENKGNILLSLDSYSGGLQNIVRYLHSSCSSVDTNSTSTTLLTTGTTITAITPSAASTCGKLGTSNSSAKGSTVGQKEQQQQHLRVSFVPLDPDLPLEGQHGAKMDIILHKLTEDILCLSKFSPIYPTIVSRLGKMNGELEQTLDSLYPRLPRDAQAAIMRVHRLMQYHKKYPDCSLVDDPSKVLTLMSRSDIAHALANCLVGVTSASGIPVASPKFVVWDYETMNLNGSVPSEDLESNENMSIEEKKRFISQLLKDAKLSYPLIAKPLQAAGTKTSHYMTVLLNESSLGHIHASSCLLQEYANHDAVLFKVYVLGNNVRVYKRPSLPNLPPLCESSCERSSGDLNSPSYVDFDSQRPYPRLSAFGVMEGNEHRNRPPPPFLSSLTTSSPSSTSDGSTAQTVSVTAEEVQPVVDAIKKAFGLELFGFDILITSSARNDQITEGAAAAVSEDGLGEAIQRQMLVVDVNYFPSYKEVSNFPSLLAQYLTQRAVDSRSTQPQAGKTDRN